MRRGAALSAGLQPIRQPVFHWRTSAAPGRVVAIGISKARIRWLAPKRLLRARPRATNPAQPRHRIYARSTGIYAGEGERRFCRFLVF